MLRYDFFGLCKPNFNQGVIPIFIDSESDTWNLFLKAVEEAIIDKMKKGVSPKVIIAVSIYFVPYKIEQRSIIANTYSIPILEDSAEVVGIKGGIVVLLAI
ncbi:DegT/DnrJ/EryC1/StrS family aminotransferase [Flavobacterium frigoris]|nr:DegT/DnrJ/EryC1/StrS family aminotransferase [Flavobacterium frigoris]